MLTHELLQRPEIRYVLHLEDDWEARAAGSEWLDQARHLLDTDPTIGQIRLRHSDEKVLAYHMVTRQPIAWQHRAGFRYAPLAHFTFNPSLIRANDAAKIYPCESEAHAQLIFLRLGLATAQLLPGVFTHLGVKQSLRTALGR